jgi:uncharacterized repeat protein (TIGR01451 family)
MRLSCFKVLALVPFLSARADDVPTAQVDAARTMAYASEIYLTTSNVNSSRFGKLFSRSVDGVIYGQPLYLEGAVAGGQKTNIVYVATDHNNVYAFDADNPKAPAPIWMVNLGPYDSGWGTGLGILSTPLIVRSSGAIYVVAATRPGASRIYQLHALDLLTGAEKYGGPVVISGSVPGTAGDAVNGVVFFTGAGHVQRTGLALSGSNVVFGFSNDGNITPYHGWIFSYDLTSLEQTGLFNTAPNNTKDESAYYTGGALWQSGRAPAVDGSGALYFESAEGVWDGTADFSDSFIKLTPGAGGLALTDWFTPAGWQTLNQFDLDLSSTGPTLIPGTNLVFGGSKTGTVYLLSATNLGQSSLNDRNVIQEFTATSGCHPLARNACAQIMGQVFWSTAPVPTLYVWGVHDVLRAYQFVNGSFQTTTSAMGTTLANFPGGIMALTSYLGTAGTGIVWAITFDTDSGSYYAAFGPATLHAYDANNLSSELWNSSQNPGRDGLGNGSNFTVPTAVNGKVYVPTSSGELVVYGLLAGPVPGDVNGDSVVNCADVSIVEASFGLSAGQSGFDLRADVNGDGLVNGADLTIVLSHLPTGTTCAIPVLMATKSHSGNFTQAQNGATYAITVSNGGGAAAEGTVTVTDTPSASLTLISMAGAGWSCAIPSCTRSDALAAGSSYAPITATVNVASSAPSQATNQASVSGGRSISASASDTASILALPSAPVLSSPANGAADVDLASSLIWNAASGAVSYDVYLGASPTPALVANIAGTSYTPGTLLPGTTYYWQVAAKNAAGSVSSAIFSFTTRRLRRR